jgi:urate oxidase
MTTVFANHHSRSLQQTMHAMGAAVLEGQPGIAEIRFSLPNKHHFAVDLSPFGLDNPNEVFHADDRPYGLIEGSVRRGDALDPGPAFDPGQGWRQE